MRRTSEMRNRLLSCLRELLSKDFLLLGSRLRMLTNYVEFCPMRSALLCFSRCQIISLIQEIHAVQWCYRIHDFKSSYYLEDLFIFGASFSFCFIFPNSSRPIHEVISSFYLWTLCKVVAILLRSRLTGSSKKIQD